MPRQVQRSPSLVPQWVGQPLLRRLTLIVVVGGALLAACSGGDDAEDASPAAASPAAAGSGAFQLPASFQAHVRLHAVGREVCEQLATAAPPQVEEIIEAGIDEAHKLRESERSFREVLAEECPETLREAGVAGQ